MTKLSLALLATLLLITGCGSKKYYTLGDTSKVTSTTTYTNNIAVAKVGIPKYLKDNALVKQVSPYEVELVDKANWLTPMQKHLTNVLIAYLQKSLNNPNVYLFPWESNEGKTKKVSLKITRFIAYKKIVHLEASYHISELKSKDSNTKLFSTTVKTKESTESMMKAMEEAYFQLAEAIKDEVIL